MTEKNNFEARSAVYEAALNNTATGLHIYRLEDPADDRSLRMEFVNPAGASLLGMQQAAMCGRLILELFPELEKDGIHSRYAAVVRSGTGFSVDEYFYRPAGSAGAWYSFNAFPLPGGRMGVLFTDITEIKQMSAALSIFRRLADSSSDAIFVVDPADGSFLDVNATACERLGYQRATLLRMGVSDVQELAMGAGQWQELSGKIAAAGKIIIEGRHKRADGTLFPVEVSINSTGIDGRPYFLAVARDITERRKMQEAVKEAETLRDLIPICAKCKKIRDDKGFWQQVESYLEKRSSARFTHGLCEGCAREIYGKEKWFKDYGWQDMEGNEAEEK